MNLDSDINSDLNLNSTSETGISASWEISPGNTDRLSWPWDPTLAKKGQNGHKNPREVATTRDKTHQMTTWCDKWYVTNGMLLSSWSLTECKMWHKADMCVTLYGMTYEFWLCWEECNCDRTSMVVWLVISWWVGCFRLVAWAGFARGVWGRKVDTTKVSTTKVYNTNMVTMVWRRVFATLGGWLAGGQWVSVPQDCLQERHDEKNRQSLIVSLNLRHRLLSVGGSFLVLWVGHGEEVFQLPLQCLKGRPLHRVLHKI